MQSLKETRHNLEAESDIKTLIGAIEQFFFFDDNGTQFERQVAIRYLANKLNLVKENALARSAEQSPDESTG